MVRQVAFAEEVRRHALEAVRRGFVIPAPVTEKVRNLPIFRGDLVNKWLALAPDHVLDQPEQLVGVLDQDRVVANDDQIAGAQKAITIAIDAEWMSLVENPDRLSDAEAG